MLPISRFATTALAALALSLAAWIAACGGNPQLKRYNMTGEVVRLDPKARTATIKHENIEGWMDAMTMDFPVRNEEEFRKLSVGRRIAATVFVQDLEYWIADIRPAPGS